MLFIIGLAGLPSHRCRPLSSNVRRRNPPFRTLSEQKLLLRLAELVALVAVVAALFMGVKTHQEQDPDFPVFVAGVVGMALLVLTFLPACMLGGEYVKTVRKPTTWRQRTGGLDSKELSAVLRWTPRLYLLVAATGMFVLAFAAIKYGSVQFRSTQTPDPSKIPGLFFYFSVFYALALPVLASASRMPGSYASHNDA